jgi:outer membrane protein assembly factor BamB
MLLLQVEVGGVHVAASPGDWPMFHADLQHTGTTSEIVTPPITLLWSYPTGWTGSSPAVSGGVVYVGSDDGKVYALDASTGAFKWSYTTGDPGHSSPSLSSSPTNKYRQDLGVCI